MPPLQEPNPGAYRWLVLPLLCLLLGLHLGCGTEPRDDDDSAAPDDDDDSAATDDDDSAEDICTDDNFEDNDTAETALPLGSGHYSGLSACAGDDDYYGVSLTETGPLAVSLSFLHQEGDIELLVLDAGGATVATSVSSSDNESATVMLDPGVYFIRVYLYALSTDLGNEYSMDISTETPPCASDAFEPNNNQATAAGISSGNEEDLVICEYDDDFYQLGLVAGDELTVDLSFIHIEGDIDLRILDANGDSLVSSLSWDDDESASFAADASGVYYVRVYMYADDGKLPGSTYDMTVSIATP